MKNCWASRSCGREAGGSKESSLVTCPATTKTGHERKSRGKSGGRYCWKVAGTLCGGVGQGTWASKMHNCRACFFFQTVQKELSAAFVA